MYLFSCIKGTLGLTISECAFSLLAIAKAAGEIVPLNNRNGPCVGYTIEVCMEAGISLVCTGLLVIVIFRSLLSLYLEF